MCYNLIKQGYAITTSFYGNLFIYNKLCCIVKFDELKSS